MFFEREKAVLPKHCRTPLEGLWFKCLWIVSLLRCFTPHSTPTTQLGIKITSIYSHRLSHCYLYGERYNTVKDKLWMCVTTPQFSLTFPGMLLHYKTDLSVGHIFKNACSLTDFVISLLWAVLDDMRASSLSVAWEELVLPLHLYLLVCYKVEHIRH